MTERISSGAWYDEASGPLNPPLKESYTREDLKNMRALKQKEEDSRLADTIVRLKKEAVLHVATYREDTTYFSDIRNHLSSVPLDRRERIIEEVVKKLKEVFPGATVEYKSQTCIRTGKEMNLGLYIDWS